MTGPNATVLCVMLTRDRPQMARKAIECFRSQRYVNKRLLVLDTGRESCGYLGDYDDVRHDWANLSLQSWTIGHLRNEAIARAGLCDIVVHWDDDDWSHPNRLVEQVELLGASGADAVGYNSMLFWDQRQGAFAGAWLYRHPDPTYCLGTSLCYPRATWSKKPFEDTSRGEDRLFINGLKTSGVPSVGLGAGTAFEPRMIARIHGGNTCSRIDPSVPDQWCRAPEFDEHCKERMKL